MFYPEKMSKVTIAAPKAHMRQVIDVLYSLNALHIQDYREREFSIGSPLADAEKVSEMLLDINAVKSIAGITGSSKKAKMSLSQAAHAVKELREKASSLYDERKTLQESDTEKKEKYLLFLRDAGIRNFSSLSGYKSLAMVTGYIKKPLKAEGIILFSRNEAKAPAVAFFRKGEAKALSEIRSCIAEEPVPVDGRGSIDAAIEAIKSRKAETAARLAEINRAIAGLGKERDKILSIEAMLLEAIEKDEAPLRFAVSRNAFVIQGWVPAKNVAKLEEKIRAITDEAFMKAAETEDAPTKLDNPRVAKPFEFFLNLYSLPRHDELDPTWLILLSFPVFYGFMIGDIGYGAVIFALAALLRNKMRNIRALIDISILSAFSTIFFGFIFGEFFGTEEIFGYHLTPFVHRIEDVNGMIVASAMLGLLHLNAGFILGFINEKHHHGIVKAVMTKLSWMTLEASGIVLFLNALGYLEIIPAIPAIFGVIAIGMIAKSEGIGGIFELPSLIANVLSYSRLAAIGLASASLALVVNRLAEPLFAMGVVGAVFGVMILIIGHSINIAMGIMDAFLQSMRLHYVELFGKFYKGAGKPYKPFGQKKSEVE
ncbi:MAG: V-type ATP synthase subunit I [Candidatus Aenigmarchaeota archaeon]|nr:V-type ATP synthase subunit I [Candidatus Aenigmarchaeota archaeon]